VRIGYLGPEGTYSHQAVLDADGAAGEHAVALATLYDTVMAVQDRTVEAALVPIENSLEGSVDVILDTLATDAPDVAIVGETVAGDPQLPDRGCAAGALGDRDDLLAPAGQRPVRALPAHQTGRREGDRHQLDG